ncbi:MAG TPA: pyridoxal-phosphate dependent enzyme [Chitinophagaceae bacterium]
MIDLPDIKNIKVDIDKIENELTLEKNVSLSILRLDKIHHEISGNKFFKLYYFLQNAIASQKKIITFGGAYSNHLAATASACKMFEINCIGIVRGEEPKDISHTLLFCKEHGMELKFISRENYKRKDDEDFKIKLTGKFGDHVLIPEGGYSKQGVDGAALISNFYSADFTHICCAVGTATTLAGLINSSYVSQHIIGFSALKGLTDFENRIQFLIGKLLDKKYSLNNDYHFGGYAKKTDELILFMNTFYKAFAIPTDFIYTAKMVYGVFELIKKNHFPAESKILCIHTGGLQGNFSLPSGILNF